MRRLYLLRHGRAERGSPGGDDSLRALAPSGRADIERLGRFLRLQGLIPDRILCSTALRTRQTVEALTVGLGRQPDTAYLHELYLADAETILSALQDEGMGAEGLMLVGHNPGLGMCAHALGHAAQAGFPTAALAIFAGAEGRDWSQAQFERYIRPSDLYAEE